MEKRDEGFERISLGVSHLTFITSVAKFCWNGTFRAPFPSAVYLAVHARTPLRETIFYPPRNFCDSAQTERKIRSRLARPSKFCSQQR